MFRIYVIRLFLAVFTAFAFTINVNDYAFAKTSKKQNAKQNKSIRESASIKSKSTKHVKAKRQGIQSAKKYRLKPTKTRVIEFRSAAYNVLRQMGYTKRQSANAAVPYTAHSWRESNMCREGVARWLYEHYGAINPAHISVLPSERGIWKCEWENGRLVRKKWAAWKTNEEAARGLIEYVQRNNPKAFQAALKGDVNAYAHAIGYSNYHSSDPKAYKKVLVDCSRYVRRLVEEA